MSKKKVEDPGKARPSAGVSSRGEKHGKIPRAAGEKHEKIVPNANPDAGPQDTGKNNRHGYTAQIQDARRSKPLPAPKSNSKQIEDAILADAERHRKHLLWNGLPSTTANADEDWNK